MKRRSFVLGLGTASASGSALIGSGAFSFVRADRDIAIDVADDSDAYLRLGACTDEDGNPKPNGNYVFEGEDGLFSISLSGDNENNPPAGSGVNPEALSKFHSVFEICNQGTQSVCVNFGVDDESDIPTIPSDADVPDRYEFGPGDPAVIFYEGDSEDAIWPVDGFDPGDGFELETGECACFGFNVRAFGFDSGKDIFAGTDLTIIANADAKCGDEVVPECGILQSDFTCVGTSEDGGVISLNNHDIQIDNIGNGAVDTYGAAVLDSPDELADGFAEFGNDDPPRTPTFDTSAPVLGIVYWVPKEGCENVELSTRDQWTNPGLTSDFSDDTVDKLSGIDGDRYSDLLDIEDFEQLNDNFDDTSGGGSDPTDLYEEIPEDAVIVPIDYSDYVVEYTEDGEGYGNPREEIDDKYSCEN